MGINVTTELLQILHITYKGFADSSISSVFHYIINKTFSQENLRPVSNYR